MFQYTYTHGVSIWNIYTDVDVCGCLGLVSNVWTDLFGIIYLDA